MEACQSKDRDRQDRDESHQPHRHDWLSLAKTILAVQYIEQRESEYAQHVDRKGDQEEEEETIVSTTDAVRHPTVKTRIIEITFGERKIVSQLTGNDGRMSKRSKMKS